MSPKVWCNGRILPADDVRISPFDRGLTVGLGLFETLLAIDGAPVFLERHLARHADGCKRLGWPKPAALEIRAAIRELLALNDLSHGDVRVRLFQTAGEGGLSDLRQGNEARLLITTAAVAPAPERLALSISPWRRNESSPLAGLKSASYAENLLAVAHARAAGFDEPLFLNTQSEVCETATANVFWARNGRVFTPPLVSGCLPGITRGWLLAHGAAAGIAMQERAFGPAELESADELFVTSATRGPVAVSRLGDRIWEQEGDRTRALRAEWNAAVRNSAIS